MQLNFVFSSGDTTTGEYYLLFVLHTCDLSDCMKIIINWTLYHILSFFNSNNLFHRYLKELFMASLMQSIVWQRSMRCSQQHQCTSVRHDNDTINRRAARAQRPPDISHLQGLLAQWTSYILTNINNFYLTVYSMTHTLNSVKNISFVMHITSSTVSNNSRMPRKNNLLFTHFRIVQKFKCYMVQFAEINEHPLINDPLKLQN